MSFQEMTEPLTTAAQNCLNITSDLTYVRCLTTIIDPESCSIVPPASGSALFSGGFCEKIASVQSCQVTDPSFGHCKWLIDRVFVDSFKCSLSSTEIVCIVLAILLVAMLLVAYGTSWFRSAPTSQARVTSNGHILAPERWHSGFSRQLAASVQRVLWLKRQRLLRTTLELLAPCGLCAFLVLMVHVKKMQGFPRLEFGSTPSEQLGLKALAMLNPALAGCSGLIIELEPCAPSATTQKFYESSSLLMAMFLLLSFSQIVSDACAGLCRDKESRLQCALQLVGLRHVPASLGWLAAQWLCSIPLALVLCLELKLGTVFPMADTGELMLFFLLFNSSMLAACLAMSTLFDRSKVASWVSVLLFISTFLVFFQVHSHSQTVQLWASLLPTVAFSLGLFGQLQAATTGLGACHTAAVYFGLSDRSADILPLSSCCWVLLLDTVWLYLAAVYLHLVLSKEYGSSRPWHFPISSLVGWSVTTQPDLTDSADGSLAPIITSQHRIESPSPEQQLHESNGRCVQFVNVEHCYGEKKALNGLSLTLYPNEITGLLGENGAGKSTAISILAGLLQHTAGTLSVFGQPSAIRPSVCFQNDVLIPALTVRQHIELVGNILGLPDDNMDWEHGAVQLGLASKLDSPVISLSGGQRRKVAVALTLLSDATLLLLDEPTAGCDPISRRQVWQLVQAATAVESRVILVCTHYLAEADELCDRIVVMASGILQCAGTSSFIKQKFGCGYTVRICRQKQCDTAQLMAAIEPRVGTVSLLSEAVREVALLVEGTGRQLAQLMSFLENNKDSLLVEEFAISMTTLEDAYIQLQQLRPEVDDHQEVHNASMVSEQHRSAWDLGADQPNEVNVIDLPSPAGTGPVAKHTPDVPALQIFKALFMKRVRYALRDRKGFIFGALLPIVFLVALAIQPGVDVTVYANHYQEDTPLDPVGYAQCLSRLQEMPCAFTANYYRQIPTVSFEDTEHPGLYMHLVGNTFVMKQLDFPQTERDIRSTMARPLDAAAFRFGWQGSVQGGAAYRFSTHLDQLELAARNENDLTAISNYGTDFVLESHQSNSRPVELAELASEGSAQIVSINSALNPHRWWQVVEDGNIILSSSPSLFRIVRGLSMDSPVCPCRDPNDKSDTTVPMCSQFWSSLTPEDHFSFCGTGAHDCDMQQCSSTLPLDSPQHPCQPLRCEDDWAVCYSQTCMRKRDLSVQAAINSMLKTLVLLLANSFAPVTLAVYIVKEKEPQANAKRQQLLAGCGLAPYWASNACFDMFTLLIPAFFSMVYCSTDSMLSNGDLSMPIICALIMAYVSAVLPLTYIISAWHTNHSRAQTSVLSVVLLTGALTSILGFLVRMISGNFSRRFVLLYLDWFLLCFPGYALQSGIMNIAMRKYSGRKFYYFDAWRVPEVLQSSCYNSDYDWKESFPFDRHCYYSNSADCCNPLPTDFVVGLRPLCYLMVEALMLWTWVLLGDRIRSCCSRRFAKVDQSAPDGTYDALDDESSVELDDAEQSHCLVVDKLCKVYDMKRCCRGDESHLALDELSFRVNDEVFGYLGVNGAGKTTTIDILTGKVAMTSGRASIGGHPVRTEQARSILSVCPQSDPLLEFLTTREQLELYATICGSSFEECDWLLRLLQLEAHSSTLSGVLSGGNKRKLSLAIALIKHPKMLFLDEPTNGAPSYHDSSLFTLVCAVAGVDPVARRYIWWVIRQIRMHRAPTVLLTSHSLDEVEALCDRIAILAHGKVHCSGTLLQLKAQHSTAYTLVCKLSIATYERDPDLLLAIESCVSGNSGRRIIDVIEAYDPSLVALTTRLEGLSHAQLPDQLCDLVLAEQVVQRCTAFVTEQWPQAKLHTRSGCTVHYSLVSTSAKLLISSVFETLENHKEELGVCEYSISQNTLDDLFQEVSHSCM